MSRLEEKQALIDAVREQYSQGMITHLEYLNSAIQQVNDYNEKHLSLKDEAFASEDLAGLELAIAVASVRTRIKIADTQLNFYI